MKKAFDVLIFSLACLTMQSCENKTIDQEVKEYCDCQKEVQNGKREVGECTALANQISDKYQFDPEAVEEISEKIKNCADELNDQND
ncbi:MAG: hypothetical protein ACO2Z9_08135 [Crocinitomicaceae bacterium]